MQSVSLQVSSTGAVLVTDWIFLVSVPPLRSQESEEILADTFPALCVVLLFFPSLFFQLTPSCVPLQNSDGALAFLATNMPQLCGVCTVQDE